MLNEMLPKLSLFPDCIVHPPLGLPQLPNSLDLPPDLAEFYQFCGGVVLFHAHPYWLEVLGPTDFARANPIIAGVDDESDRSHLWFVLAQADEQFVTIDLAPDRIGRCYDSFWDRHAVRGSCPIIASSFTEFLERAIQMAGRAWYWLDPAFTPLGDAYDET